MCVNDYCFFQPATRQILRYQRGEVKYDSTTVQKDVVQVLMMHCNFDSMIDDLARCEDEVHGYLNVQIVKSIVEDNLKHNEEFKSVKTAAELANALFLKKFQELIAAENSDLRAVASFCTLTKCLGIEEEYLDIDTLGKNLKKIVSIVLCILSACHQFYLNVVTFQVKIPLPVLWFLHVNGILFIDTYLSGLPSHLILDKVRKVRQFLLGLILRQDLTIPEAEVLTGVLQVFIRSNYSSIDSDVGRKMKTLSATLLDSLMQKLLEKFCSNQPTSFTNLFEMINLSTSLPESVIKKFYQHVISLMVVFKPEVKVAQAFQDQSMWKFANQNPTLKLVFMDLLVPFNCSELVGFIGRILARQEVSWGLLLSLVSVAVVCFEGAGNDFKALIHEKLISGLNQQGDSSKSQEDLISAMLIARQVCLETNSYSSWFGDTFGEQGTICTTRRAYETLIKFLTDLVPFEPLSCLQAHVSRAPNPPKGCFQVLSEYSSLAKTRLEDLKDSKQKLQPIFLTQGQVSFVKVVGFLGKINYVLSCRAMSRLTRTFHKALHPSRTVEKSHKR